MAVSKPSTFAWYATVRSSTPLEQGDFLLNCPVLVPSVQEDLSGDSLQGDVVYYNVIIMSQSCDLIEKKIDIVLVCPVYSLEEACQSNAYFAGRDGKEALRKGHIIGHHLLNQCNIDGAGNKYLVVDFKNVHGIPLQFAISFAGKMGDRIRLLPPYREHLSQAFARFFMRVGLPADIPQFK